MEHLLEYSTYDEKFTELIRFIKQGDYENTVRLIESGVDPSQHESLALQHAADNGYVDIVKYLLEDGRVDVNAKESRAILYASNNSHKEIVNLLLNKDIDEEVIPYVHIASKWNDWYDILDKLVALDVGLKYATKLSFDSLDNYIKDSLKRVYELTDDVSLSQFLTMMQ